MKAIYARVSTAEQSGKTQTQTNEIIYLDRCSGSISFFERQQAKELIQNKEITQIEVLEISRLGRNLSDILKTIEYFTSKKIDIYITNLGLHTLVNGEVNSTATVIISIMGSIAQLERDLLLERVRAGVAIAKSEGRYTGRKIGAVSDLKKKYEADIPTLKKYLKLGIPKSHIADKLNITRPTLYKLISFVQK